MQKNEKLLEGALGAPFIILIGAKIKYREVIMDIAILADIHGNYEAFRTCVQFISDRGIQDFIFLGDYVGELAFPQETMELIYALKEKYHCLFLRGNKEDYWIAHRKGQGAEWKRNDSTTGSLLYTYENLTEKDLSFFESLPISIRLEDNEAGEIIACHGSPFSNTDRMFPDEAGTHEIMDRCDSDLIICGHTHTQRIYHYHGKTFMNPGSVGVPFCSCGKSQFMILHGTENGWKEEFISLRYDVEKAISDLHLSGLDLYAPYWCRISEQLLRTGIYPHADLLDKAMQYCRVYEQVCNWPDIPEKYWAMAYEEVFGNGQLQSRAVTDCEGKNNFPVCLKEKAIYESKWMTLYADQVRMPNGAVIDAYHRVHVPNESICVVIVNDEDKIMLISSKRYTTGRMEWEVPAGRIEPGECAEDAARREAYEETGCQLKELTYMCSQNPSNGISDILIHYYLAKVCKETGDFDKNEVDHKYWAAKREVLSLLKNNQSRCGVSMYALLYALQFYLC